MKKENSMQSFCERQDRMYLLQEWDQEKNAPCLQIGLRHIGFRCHLKSCRINDILHPAFFVGIHSDVFS